MEPASGKERGRSGLPGVLSRPDIKHQLGGEGGKKGGLSLGFQRQLTKEQEFSMLLQGDKVVKQVCGGSENNGKCSSQKLLRIAGRGRRGGPLQGDDVGVSNL